MLNAALKTVNLMNRRVAESVNLENEAANVTLDAIGEAVLRTNLRGDVVFLNRMAEKMTGWSREEALGRPVADVLRIVDGVGGAAVLNVVESAMKERRSAGIEANCSNCILIRRDGFECEIEKTVTPVRDPDGAI